MDEKLFSDEIRERERKRRRGGLLWSIASFVLHIALFVAIVMLTPVKSLVFEEKKKSNPAADLSADRIEQIADSLSEARINELLRQLEAMQAVLHNMDLMKEELQKDYDAFAEKSAQSMKEELSKMIDEVETAQKSAQDQQRPMVEKVEKMFAEEKLDLMDENRSKWLEATADELMKVEGGKISDAQARAGNALDRIQVQAQFAGYNKTSEASEKVREAQIEAATMQYQAQKEASEIGYRMSEMRTRVNEVKDHEKRLQEQKDRLAKAEQDRKDAAVQVADATAKRDAAEKARDAAPKDDRKVRDEANRKFHEERSRADRERRRMESAERTANDAKRRIADLETRLAERKAAVKSLEDVRRESVNSEQVKKLERAEKAQTDIKERVDILRKVLESDVSDIQKLVKANRQENSLVTRNTSTMKLVDAYEIAKEIESAITESYKDIKATQTAIERKMSFEAAQKITDVAKAVRLEANREAIEDSPRTKEALDAQKMAQAEVVRETDAMVETVVAMMEETLELVRPDDPKKGEVKGRSPKTVPWLREKDFAKRASDESRAERLENMQAAADYQVAITAAAAENEQERAKDLTKVMDMTSAADAGSSNGQEGDKGQGGASVAASADDTKLGEGSPARGNVLVKLGSRMPGLVGGNVIRFADGPVKDGIPAKWMYVQDWYVIGPFPNPDRVNLRRKFPPESVIDLDATYVGKDGKTVKWEFMQTKNMFPREAWHSDLRPEIVPFTAEEYGIWYAYAEVFSDVTCDRWIAVGSDDRSDIWINDAPVWGSSNTLKAWCVDEGYRRVRLNKGRNRILARVENGWHLIGWSLCISVEDGDLAK
ncbi:MAG: hypothetical protein J5727_08395 [Kiritimatiellae bacterium]|nr:hypothetical protein [Kiritimatiellia bacterium]